MLNFKLLFLYTCILGTLAEDTRKFPDDFLFGIGTASYQIEGAWNVSDKGENIWDRFAHTKGNVKNGDNGDIACNSYHNYKRDVEMLVELNVDFYRFSLSWSRILPRGFANKISADGIKYYNNLIDELIAHNITPSITLYHWDLPQTLQDLGGWTNPLMIDYYADYAKVVFEAFGDRVDTWATFNEPKVICHEGYGLNIMAPGMNLDGIANYQCGHTLIKAHAKVYHLYNDVYRTKNGKISIGISGSWHEPKSQSAEDIQASNIALQFELGWFCHPIFTQEGDYPALMKERIAKKSLEQGYPKSRLPEFTQEEIEYIRGTYDYFGLNHYTSYISTMNDQSYDDDKGIIEHQDPKWSEGGSFWLKVVPWGFTKLLNWIKTNFKNPELIVFENGYSDNGEMEDNDRKNYINMYLNAMLNAIEDGCNIKGYTVWSLMDNFEWLQGYTEKFGLFHVDFESPERTRTAKSSVSYYKKLINTRSIDK